MLFLLGRERIRKAPLWRIVPVDWFSHEADHVRAIRVAVFVEELGFPLAEEFDHIDTHAYHVIAYDQDGRPCATARLYTDRFQISSARIGRVAVLAEERHKGCGKAVIEHLLHTAQRLGHRKVVLSAQEQSIGFYLKLGFTPYGPHYLDAHTNHQDMVLYLPHPSDNESATRGIPVHKSFQ